MTNKEAYLTDLDDLKKEIDFLLSMIPVGKTKTKFKRDRQQKMRPAEPELL